MSQLIFSTELVVLHGRFTLAAVFFYWLTGGLPAFGQSGCVNFPANYVPFSSISYVTAPNTAGDLLVVGSLAGGLSAFGNAIPQAASSINQQYCDAQVQFAPQHSYPHVYVPTAAERAGNFSAFAGLLINPATNQPYPNGVIPVSQLGNPYYAWRIAANSLNITGVQNAASNIVPGLPNSGIAQGAIFVVKGTGLGPAALSTASTPFQSTSVSNTSVAVNVGTTTVNALMYYTSAGQVAALLPSNTPTGAGTISVTYNGQTSAQVPITVVANNVGVFTIDSSGQGPGIVTYADYSLVSAVKSATCGGPNTTCGAANPGDTLILWATGLGPVSGSDAAGVGLGQNMPNLPLTLWLGGVQAPVIYQGRSGCCIGEDQIVFTVPNSVPTGCALPVVVQIGDQISNNTVMPVAKGSRSCTPANAVYAAVHAEQTPPPPITFVDLDLERLLSNSASGYEDDGQFQTLKVLAFQPALQPFFISLSDSPPLGTCIVYSSLSSKNNNGIASAVPIDAGSSVTVTGPSGSLPVPANQGFNTIKAAGTFLVPGSYTLTGPGGADVGPINANFTIPTSPTLVSPLNNTTVTRSSGMTVTWTGGGGDVSIQINSATDNLNTNGSRAMCTAPGGSGTFTIPPYVLLALPAGNFAGFIFGTPYVYTPITATGLSFGIVQTDSQVKGFGNGAGTGSFTLK